MPDQLARTPSVRDSARISVVIPTTGRPEAVRAAASVRDQLDLENPPEILVIADGVSQEDLPPELNRLADRVVETGTRIGGGAARNLGITTATGNLVAFLDDDDEWLPNKLSEQLAILSRSEHPERTVVSCRHIHVDANSAAESGASPTDLVQPGQHVEDYLFRRRRPSSGRASMYTSTLLCSREIALQVPWDSTLSRHQDWDWLIRLGRVAGAEFVHAPSALVRIQTGSVGSISAKADWKSSLSWGQSMLADRPATLADFLAGQTLRYAISSRSIEGTLEVARAIGRCRRIPAPGPLAIGLAGVLPRTRLENLMTRRGTTKLRPVRAHGPTVLMSVRANSMARNPYNTQLQASLSAAGVTVKPWTWRRALFGRYDVLHVHWPEYLMTHRRRALAGVSGTLGTFLLRRLELTKTPVVRTMHNAEPHFPISDGAARRISELDRLTAHRIVLHPAPESGPDVTLIPHGHYIDWYANTPKSEPQAGRVLFFGLIRPYKEVDRLIDAFRDVRDDGVELRIVGQPETAELREQIAELAARDPRVFTRLEFLAEEEIVREITAAALVALPYRQVYNSGAVLLALSLRRQVLVTDSASMRALRDEVGSEWVILTDSIDSEVLSDALSQTGPAKAATPDLSSRDWDAAARAHLDVYASALSRVRTGT